MQLTSKHLRPTKEHTRLRRTMNLPNTLEHHIPVRPSKVRRRPETRNRITIRIRIIDHDICRIVDLDLRSEVRVDLDMVIHILGFDSEEEGAEPFEGAEITAYPEEVDFAEARLLLGVVHAVPDGFEDGCERRDTDTSTDEERDLVLEDVFGGGAKGAVDVDSREDTADGRVDGVCAWTVFVNGYDLGCVGFSSSCWPVDFTT